MTHNDIYTKFMIEYDKANVTSSYPSLTKYEIQTILDKSYLALIARKLTGNNTRRVPFEYDVKAIEDLRKLIETSITEPVLENGQSTNEYIYLIPKNVMYFLEGKAVYAQDKTEEVILVNHKIAQNFKSSTSNMPWIKTPVVYLEGDRAHLLVDAFKYTTAPQMNITYIKNPKMFVGSEDETNFELSDTMAEELISLAIVMALENVESPRLQTKVSTLPLEG